MLSTIKAWLQQKVRELAPTTYEELIFAASSIESQESSGVGNTPSQWPAVQALDFRIAQCTDKARHRALRNQKAA